MIPNEVKTTGVELTTIADLTPDERNANKGTQRGLAMLEDSLRRHGAGRSILVDKHGRVIAGNKTLESAASIGLEDVVIVKTDGHKLVAVQRTDIDLDTPEGRRLAVADNRTSEVGLDWNVDALSDLIGEGVDLDGLFSDDELSDLLKTEPEPKEAPEQARATLAERFLVPPFSVLDARQGYWQERKRAWLALGIQSELGRGDTPSTSARSDDPTYREIRNRKLSPGGAPRDAARLVNGHTVRGDGKGNGLLGESEQARTHYKARPATSNSSQDRLIALQQTGDSRCAVDGTAGNIAGGQTGTSIFDPVLCELAYRWFCPPGGHVLDPFAGGSVRGIVAAQLGRHYTGIDLSPAQLEANRAQAVDIAATPCPRWILGDAREVTALAPGEYDLLFTCPPYFDLEVYSDNPADLSTADDYTAFLAAYRAILRDALALLKPDRFACITVGDVRDKAGIYRNFVSDTIAAFQDAGAKLYNEAILVTACGSLPIRAAKQFSSGRKLGKTHQNVLVFVKGDPAKATKACGPVEVGELPKPADAMGLAPERA